MIDLYCLFFQHDWDIVRFTYHSVYLCRRCHAKTWYGQPHEYEKVEKIYKKD